MGYSRRDLIKATLAASAGSLFTNARGFASTEEKKHHANAAEAVSFEPNWRSLRRPSSPQWLRDAKFGIYTHWGVYSVPAIGPNTSWYGHNMYRNGTALTTGRRETNR